ncbi:Uncharacterised protein [Legionella spiritensis]|nr:Uncharacterised protein [Legionella spiritensis]
MSKIIPHLWFENELMSQKPEKTTPAMLKMTKINIESLRQTGE